MITVNEDQLNAVEYLLNQSSQGNHVLFEPEMIRQVFLSSPIPISEAEAYEVEHHIEKTLELATLDRQKIYLAKLPETILHRVIKTYFNILENSLFEKLEHKH